MIIVTGGAGFIGTNIVRELNQIGETEILIVDNFLPSSHISSPKFLNLEGTRFADYMSKREFREALASQKLSGMKIRAILHNGACSNTLEDNGEYMMDNNFTYSKQVLHYALEHQIPMVYASTAAVYGLSKKFNESPENEHPLNIYGFSKLVFDNYVRRLMPAVKSTVVGLRYFNVYGPYEQHKGRMASVIHHFARQLKQAGKIRMFEGSGGYGNGEQRRDFVFVRDLARINLHFAGLLGDISVAKGVFSAGTGMARTFNDVARALMSEYGKGQIEYIPFPKDLANRYQHFTRADISLLRKAGWGESFTSLEEGVRATFKVQPII
jgi:ADP-L-glycero-D-manno-heptose 6-epimerase